MVLSLQVVARQAPSTGAIIQAVSTRREGAHKVNGTCSMHKDGTQAHHSPALLQDT